MYAQAVFKYPDPKHGPNKLSLKALQSANPPSKTLIEMTEAEQNRVFLQVASRLAGLIIEAERKSDDESGLPSETVKDYMKRSGLVEGD
jgi:hypothetical protein